jgi:hypothetical protein
VRYLLRVAGSIVEQAILSWFKPLSWRAKHGLDIASGMLSAAHEAYCVRCPDNVSAMCCRSNYQPARCELRMQKNFKDYSP